MNSSNPDSKKATLRKDLAACCAAFAATALMLTVIQTPIDWSWLAWIAYVPFLMVCSPERKTRPLVLMAYVVGLVYWLGNLYWVFPVTKLGWTVFCLYTAALWPILAISVRLCRKKRIPLFPVAAVLIVGIENLQGFPLGGFLWRFLAHSQYRNASVIQIADIFGAAGVSFLIALVNAAVADILLSGRRAEDKPAVAPSESATLTADKSAGFGDGCIFCMLGKSACRVVGLSGRNLTVGNVMKGALAAIAVAATVVYGRWRIAQSAECVTPGPLVAAVQSNVPQSVKRTFSREGELFSDVMRLSRQAAAAGADFIAWPETMVQATLDYDVWPFLEDANKNKEFDFALRGHAAGTCYLLVGAYGGHVRLDEELDEYLEQYNSAFLYRPDGRKDPQRYDKIHLVLFGEYLPFKKSFHLLYTKLRACTPFNYDYSLEAGTRFTIFDTTYPVRELNDGLEPPAERKQGRFGVIICYEGSVPAIARGFALDKQGQKAVDWLVNISNDGWFVRFQDEPGAASASAELPQHAVLYAFRAVENRVAILRSVNTGVSCLVDSLGRIHDGYIAGSEGFPQRALDRKGMSGWFADRMPIDNRVTLFSKYGQWLDHCCMVGVGLLWVWQGGASLRRRRQRWKVRVEATRA